MPSLSGKNKQFEVDDAWIPNVADILWWRQDNPEE